MIPMKIVMSSEYAIFGGGISQSLNELAPILRGKGHSVRLMTVENEHLQHLPEDTRARLYKNFDDIFWLKDVSLKDATTSMFHYLGDCDVVHVHETLTFRNLSLPALLAAKAKGIPSILTIHTSHPSRPESELEITRAMLRQQSTLANRIVAVSPSVRYSLVERYGVPSDRVDVVENGVNLTRFTLISKQQARTTLGLPDDKLILIFVGRSTEQKGYKILADLAGRLDGTLLIVSVGADKTFNSLRNVKTYQYEDDRVLSLLYSAADGLFLPSTACEGLPLVILESLACGTPVLVADALGNTDVVNPDVGELFEPNNLEDALNKLPKLKTKLPEACRKLAEKYPWERTVERLSQLYDKNRF